MRLRLGLSSTSALTGAVVAAGLLMGGVAHAGVMAVSIFEVESFQAIDATTGAQLVFGTQVGGISGNNSADTDANLGGGSAGDSALVPIVPPGFGAIDLLQACVGACPPFAENSYAGIGFAPPPGTTYAVSDMVLSGTTVDITPTGFPNSGGVDASTRADVVIAGGGNVGSSSTNAGTDVNFDFTALTDLTAAFTLDFILQLRAYLETDPGETGSAQASASWNLNLVNTTTGASVLNWAPGDINTSRTATVGPLTNLFVDEAGSLTSPTFLLVENNNYQLSVRHTSQADAQFAAVPEPFTLGMLGAGLLALGWMRRRRD